jgi:hypothetical protein
VANTVSGGSAICWRDLACCLSLANLLCLGIWRVLLVPGQAELYFLRTPGHSSFFLAGLSVFAALGGGFYAAAVFVRRSGSRRLSRLARWGLISLTALAMNALRHAMPGLSRDSLSAALGPTGAWGLAGLSLLGLVWAAHRWTDGLSRAITHALQVLSPFVLATTVGVIAGVTRNQARPPATLQDRPPLALVEGTPRRRVVLVIFDELDQEATFGQREAGLALPELDSLRARSVWATRAYPPSNTTWTSVPAMLTGLPVSDVRWVGPSELLLEIPGQAGERPWSEEPSVFTRAHALGLNGGLVGWAHPYCRVIGQSMASCNWFPYVPPPGTTLRETLFTHLSLIAETVPGLARLDLRRRLRVGRAYATTPAHHMEAYLGVRHDALKLVADPRLALALLHYPVPHGPFIWDRRRRVFRLDGTATYADNLALADLALGELRVALEESGLATTTALVVTSDHWRRAVGGVHGPHVGNPLHRVPLLVRLPGQEHGTPVDGVLRTTLVHDLILHLLQGEPRDAQGVAAWLSRRRGEAF